MVRTSNTSTPYSLYTVTWEGLQPGAEGAGRERAAPRAPRAPRRQELARSGPRRTLRSQGPRTQGPPVPAQRLPHSAQGRAAVRGAGCPSASSGNPCGNQRFRPNMPGTEVGGERGLEAKFL